ncbi:HK97 gp10 family phage protein [Paenibacillus agilis]|uniref:HK97 gp10 family phage protein n=1 Tax=Paenibacillus agilis TaxID=3020863 RepID=A0A559IX74_9BACL|nr:HK97 gp10 family phage protein [Paenibacillus agilis]TVX92219.1 HK97 gp10 family phage protein [Paenibacillus agilis]
MADFEFKIEGMEKWQKWLAQLEQKEVKTTKDRILRKSGMQALAHLDDLTPVRSGVLRESFQFGDKNNVFQLQVGKASYIFVGTSVAYAQFINDGFEQKAGRFVPGFWKSGVFHYVPYEQAKAQKIGGMVLSGKIIPGAHMFEKTMNRLEEDMPDIVDFEFRRLYRLLH